MKEKTKRILVSVVKRPHPANGRVVYSLKTRRRFNSHAKCTAGASPSFTSLLLAVSRITTVATASKK